VERHLRRRARAEGRADSGLIGKQHGQCWQHSPALLDLKPPWLWLVPALLSLTRASLLFLGYFLRFSQATVLAPSLFEFSVERIRLLLGFARAAGVSDDWLRHTYGARILIKTRLASGRRASGATWIARLAGR
jgi:hypothetical protein